MAQRRPKMPKNPKKCLKFPAYAGNFGFAYYAKSNAGIFRLALHHLAARYIIDTQLEPPILKVKCYPMTRRVP